jgi:hypothetical protein
MSNDSIWFSNFDWLNSENPAKCIKLDVCWEEAGGNTFSFLDAYLENGLYVTIGLRQTENGDRKASFSVFQHNACSSLFEQVSFNPNKDFYYNPGTEGDKYCIGDYLFEFGEYHQFIIKATEDKITGRLCRLSDQMITEIATVLIGRDSLIKANSSNGFALEHFGMNNPCEYKSQIMIRTPLRIDVKDIQATARGGIVRYQKCQNSLINKGLNGNILLSHGGDVTRSIVDKHDFLSWD